MKKKNSSSMRVEHFWALSIVLAHILYTATGDPARWPGFPQPWCTGMVLDGRGQLGSTG